MQRGYWLNLFSGETWQEFLDAGASVSGFRQARLSAVQRIQVGDYLLCYMTGVSRFVGVLEVTSAAYIDKSPIWHDEEFPCRVRVRLVCGLSPDTGVPILTLRDRLSIFQDIASPNAWTGHVRGSPSRWERMDGEVVTAALIEAKQRPVVRPVDPRKLAYRPKALRARIGSVTVPGTEMAAERAASVDAEVSDHSSIQLLLLKLGSDLGLDVWVARNDRGRTVEGQRFSELKRLREALPLQFDDATNRTIELIDVLWMKSNAIVAAFEIERTTSIHSGLLRMADLIAMQPNLSIPLYIVAPDERRAKVIAEVNRPVFSMLAPPMSQMCRFVSFSQLRGQVEKVGPYLRYLKPEIIDEISESCEVPEA